MRSQRRPLLPVTIDGSGRLSKKKTLRFPSDDCEFYSNIWETQRDPPQKFIDIAQVAHAVVSMGKKYEYESLHGADFINIWSSTVDFESSERATPKTSNSDQCTDVVGFTLTENAPPFSQYTNKLQKKCSASFRTIPNPSPTKITSEKIVFSSIVPVIELQKHWSSRFLLGLHEPIRHALYVINGFLDTRPQKWDPTSFFAWFTQYFSEFVQVQHAIKSKVIQPLIQITCLASRAIDEYYDEVYLVLHTVNAQEQIIAKAYLSGGQPWEHCVSSLHAHIDKLNIVLPHVLNLEEHMFQPSIAAAFTEETFQKVVLPRVLSFARPKRVIIPWIVERCRVWGGEVEAANLKRQLSLTSRFLYDRVWYPYFAQHVVVALNNLDVNNSNMKTKSETWLECVVM